MPALAAVVAEAGAELVLCPPEAPARTRYRARAAVECGTDNMVGRCLCLGRGPRRTGRAVGTRWDRRTGPS